MAKKFDKMLGRIREKDKTTATTILDGIIPNSDYAIGDICQLGVHHETVLFLECVTAGNTGLDIPNINTYGYDNNHNRITIGTAVFARRWKTNCDKEYQLAPSMVWYKIGSIPATRLAGAFDLNILYSSYNYLRLSVELTLLINGTGAGSGNIVIDYKSRETSDVLYPEVALILVAGVIEIWIHNTNIPTYALSYSSMNYDDVFNIDMANDFATSALIPEGTVLAQIDTETADPGIQGIKGDTGDQGIQGIKGDTGDQGIQGIKGDTGDQGIQGVKGDTGDPGTANETLQSVMARGATSDRGPTFAGAVVITDGEATILGKKAVKLPNGVPGIDAGLSVRTGVANESIVQFGNNHDDYYTGAIDQSRAGAMIRLDTRNVVPVPGGHAYSAVQIQTRGAGVAHGGYKVPFQMSGQAPEGAFCLMASGVIYFYYGINVQGKPVTGVSAPVTIAANYTILAADDIIICNSATPITVSIPVGTASNRRLIIKNIGAGTVTLSGGETDVIDSVPTYDLYQYDSATILDYAANNWLIL